MKDVLADIQRWRDDSTPMALARVIRVEGSGPRPPGATMVVRGDGRVAGSVSGGCIEGAVVSEATDALADGKSRLVRFGYSDDDAFAVGLTCGGIITIFVAPNLLNVQASLEQAIASNEPVVLATVISVTADDEALDLTSANAVADEPDCLEVDSFGDDLDALMGTNLLAHHDGRIEGNFSGEFERIVSRDANAVLAAGKSMLRRYGSPASPEDRVTVFFESFTPPPHMIIFGAVDFTGALVRIGKVLGYRVTVCDARAPFATTERFPLADEVVVDWPNRYLDTVASTLGPRDCICVLTHDAKFDVPAIKTALETTVGYIGAMGSRRTQAARVERLLEAGVREEDLGRVMAPIGLDLGARTPEETAVAICAEIIAHQTGHRPASLRDGDGPIHGSRLATSAAH